jgi:hypothetical protein
LLILMIIAPVNLVLLMYLDGRNKVLLVWLHFFV